VQTKQQIGAVHGRELRKGNIHGRETRLGGVKRKGPGEKGNAGGKVLWWSVGVVFLEKMA